MVWLTTVMAVRWYDAPAQVAGDTVSVTDTAARSQAVQVFDDHEVAAERMAAEAAAFTQKLAGHSDSYIIAVVASEYAHAGAYALEMTRRLKVATEKPTSELVSFRESAVDAATRSEAAAARSEAAAARMERRTNSMIWLTVALLAFTVAVAALSVVIAEHG